MQIDQSLRDDWAAALAEARCLFSLDCQELPAALFKSNKYG